MHSRSIPLLDMSHLKSLSGVKRTCVAALHESAFDPKRTWRLHCKNVSLWKICSRTSADHFATRPRSLRRAKRPSVRRAGSLPLWFIERNREVAHALSGRVVDRVRNRCRNADNAYLAEPLDAEPIAVVWLVDEDDSDVVDVRVHWHMIFGDVGINDATGPVIDQCLLM